MIRYFSGCTNPPTEAAARRQPRLGMLAQPGNALHRRSTHFTSWGIDCGVFGKAARGHAWTLRDTEDYLAYLRTVTSLVDTATVAFAVTPDVLRFVEGVPIGDAVATWELSKPVFPLIRGLGLPAALVAQDGILDTPVEWELFDALFIGGSDQMKLGPEGAEIARQAKAAGKWVHMGRVNSKKRLAYAASIGCDSADGTFIGFGPMKNLPKVLAWLEATATPAPAVEKAA